MCIFCAAVPATAALGAAANAKKGKANKAEATRRHWLLAVPVGKATGFAIAGLMVASVAYHSQIGPV